MSVARLDELSGEATTRWLRDHLGLEPPITFTQLAGGNSNLTVLAESGEVRRVLRMPPAARMDASAHSMEREHRVLTAVVDRGVRVPEPLGLCTDSNVPVAPFLVLSYVDGVSLTEELPAAYADPADAVTTLGCEMIDGLAALHNVDWRDAGLEGFGRPEGFLERQVSRWRTQYERHGTRDLPRFEQVATWLEEHRPAPQPPAVIHGDFHLDNCLVGRDAPRLVAIVDWELSTIGDPLLDLGLLLAFWGPRRIDPCGMERIQAVSRLDGVVDTAALARRYAEATGCDVAALDYYRALAFWKLAAIVESAYTLYLRGENTTDYARRLGDDVPRLLEEAAGFAGLG